MNDHELQTIVEADALLSLANVAEIVAKYSGPEPTQWVLYNVKAAREIANGH